MKEEVIEIIDTKITDKWGVMWDEMEMVRDFLQNFYDANEINNIKIQVKDKTVEVSAPAAFDYQELIYLGSDKGNNPDKIGQYGEGWKASVLNALRNYNCSVSMVIGDKKLIFYFDDKKIGETYKRVIFCKVVTTYPITGSMLIVENCSEKIIQEFQFGFRYFYYDNNPLFGQKLAGTYDNNVIVFKSKDKSGYVFYKRLLRSRIDAPIVVVCNKPYQNVEAKIKHDRDRKAFNDEVLSKVLRQVFNRIRYHNEINNVVNHLKDFWITGHRILSLMAESIGWRTVNIVFPDNYYAKDTDENFNKVDQKDYDLIIETDRTLKEFQDIGYFACPTYMAKFGMKTPKKVAKEKLSNKLKKHLQTNSRDLTYWEQSAINLLLELIKNYSRELYSKSSSITYLIADSEEIIKNIKTNRGSDEKKVVLSKVFFTYNFIDALIHYIKEWEEIYRSNKEFSDFYIALISSLTKDKDSQVLFKRFEENWNQLIEKIVTEGEFIPLDLHFQKNKLKKVKDLRKYFVEGDMEKVINEIQDLNIEDKVLSNNFILLAEQYNTWHKGFLNGIEDSGSPIINKVKKGLLEIINELDK